MQSSTSMNIFTLFRIALCLHEFPTEAKLQETKLLVPQLQNKQPSIESFEQPIEESADEIAEEESEAKLLEVPSEITTGTSQQEMRRRIFRIYTYLLERISAESLALVNIQTWPLTVPASEIQVLQTPIGWLSIPDRIINPRDYFRLPFSLVHLPLLEEGYSPSCDFEAYLLHSLFAFPDSKYYYKTGCERVIDYFLSTKKEDEQLILTQEGIRLTKKERNTLKQEEVGNKDTLFVTIKSTEEENRPVIVEKSVCCSIQKNHSFHKLETIEEYNENHNNITTIADTVADGFTNNATTTEDNTTDYNTTDNNTTDTDATDTDETDATAIPATTLTTKESLITTIEIPITTTSTYMKLDTTNKSTSSSTFQWPAAKTSILPPVAAKQDLQQKIMNKSLLDQEMKKGYGGAGAILATDDEKSSTDIYKIIIKSATNFQTGQLSEPVSLQDLKYKVISRGYTVKQLNSCIEEYEFVKMWYLIDNGNTLMMNCKKNKRNRR